MQQLLRGLNLLLSVGALLLPSLHRLVVKRKHRRILCSTKLALWRHWPDRLLHVHHGQVALDVLDNAHILHRGVAVSCRNVVILESYQKLTVLAQLFIRKAPQPYFILLFLSPTIFNGLVYCREMSVVCILAHQ